MRAEQAYQRYRARGKDRRGSGTWSLHVDGRTEAPIAATATIAHQGASRALVVLHGALGRGRPG
jgi:hypothetical protein